MGAEDPLTEHLERHPHCAFAARAPDPGITLGLKLGDSSVVGHPAIKARSERVGNSSYSLGSKDSGLKRPQRWGGWTLGP